MTQQVDEFEVFWQVYPLHVAKLAARKAFVKARKQATFSELVDGVRRYIRGKPSFAAWAHAATWLNAGRWMDEYPGLDRPRFECPHTPTCNSKVWCLAQQARDRGEV